MENIRYDFAFLLFSLTLVTGVIWAIDHVFFAKARLAKATASGRPAKDPGLVDISKSFFPVILIVFIIRSFLAEPFKIPSNSMMPTLLTGDFILVNKFSYGIRVPVLHKKVIDLGGPERGDVVVFRYPGNGSPDDPNLGSDYIKRVVGLPGDEVSYYDRILSINGVPVVSETLPDRYVGVGNGREMTGALVKNESLPGAEHQILEDASRNLRGEGSWTVGENEFLVLGDNRDNSEDGRFWGMVPERNLVGKAFMIWLNWDRQYGEADFSRVGTKIK